MLLKGAIRGKRNKVGEMAMRVGDFDANAALLSVFQTGGNSTVTGFYNWTSVDDGTGIDFASRANRDLNSGRLAMSHNEKK